MFVDSARRKEKKEQAGKLLDSATSTSAAKSRLRVNLDAVQGYNTKLEK